MRNLFTKTRAIPVDTYKAGDDFDPKAAFAFPRESPASAWLGVMLAIQDRILDATALATNMATAKEPGYQAHAAGQLCALLELYDDLEQQRAAAMSENL
jgi:hypothetical protein